MTVNETKNFLLYLYKIIGVPLQLLSADNQQALLTLPENSDRFDPLGRYRSLLLQKKEQITYIITKEFLDIGCISIDDTQEKIIVGPISNTTCSTENIRRIALDLAISQSHLTEFSNYFKKTEIYSFNQFINLLCFIHFCFNHKQIQSIDLIKSTGNRERDTKIKQLQTQNQYEAREIQDLHNTYEFEKRYLSYIKMGQVEKLRRFVVSAVNLRMGQVADNNIRQTKNLFISSITLATRAAIEGGVDTETAYQLSDAAIMEMERLSSGESIAALELNTILQFTERVKSQKIPAGTSQLTKKCLNYIATHTDEALCVDEIAAAVGYSRSYLSQLFKREVGISLHQYVQQQRLNEAKDLLLFTNKSINEISTFLHFSTQSYFQNVFKRSVGVTPYQYRQQKKLQA